MGIFDSVRGKQILPTVEAAISEPYIPSYWSTLVTVTTITREAALTVPAVSRARDIICGTIGAMPIHRWAINGNRRLDPIPLQYAPDPDMPKAVTYAWLADSMLFYGVGYVQVLEVYADGRVSRFRWIDPQRVQPVLNSLGTEIQAYLLDGVNVPQSGIGSLKVFPGIDQGLLSRAGRTIEVAVQLEKAAELAAKEPTPTAHLMNKGVPLPKERLAAVKAEWAEARKTGRTAVTNGDFDLRTVGYSASEQQLVEARQYTSAELSRAVGIPAWYLNADAASMTYSNTEQERRSLIDFSLKPYLTAIAERLSMNDFVSRDIELRFDLDDFLRGSTMEQMQVITGYLAAGVLSEDEAREAIDLSPRGSEPNSASNV